MIRLAEKSSLQPGTPTARHRCRALRPAWRLAQGEDEANQLVAALVVIEVRQHQRHEGSNSSGFPFHCLAT